MPGRTGGKGSWKCTACDSAVAPRKLSEHSETCEAWKAKFGDPLPRFKYDPFSKGKKELFEEDKVENADYLVCQVCLEYGYELRFSRIVTHLKVHSLDADTYQAKYPGVLVRLSKTLERRKATVRAKYGVDNVFQAEEIKQKSKETMLATHGVEHNRHSAESNAKRAATNLERYGAENPFGSKEIQEKLDRQASQRPEVVQRRQATNQQKHGSKSFLQSEEWLEKQRRAKEERVQQHYAELRASGEFEECPCGAVFKKITSRHKSICDHWESPEKPEPCLCGHESTSRTQMKRHRRTCEVWQSRDKKAVAKQRFESSMVEKYGVTNPRHIPEVNEKIAKTNLERYGAENPFGSTEVQAKIVETNMERYGGPTSMSSPEVQAKIRATHLEKYGVDNPFAAEEVKEKIRETMLEKYGAENPQQSPEIRARTKATNKERYGHEHTLAAPEIRKRIVETNLERYGGVAPSCSPEVVEKARQTNLERWGVEWTCQHPEIRQKQLETMEANYGSHFFASEEGLKAVREGMMAKYGVEHIAQLDGFWERQVEKFVERYGVTHPLQLQEFLDKRAETCQERYGVDSPLQSPEVMARSVATCQERYGVNSPVEAFLVREKTIRTCLAKVGSTFPEFDTPAQSDEDLIERYGVKHQMQHREYAAMMLQKMADPNAGPNGLERPIMAMAPELVFTGNRTFWRWLPKLGHHKNPDFILPGPDPKKPKKGVTKCVEAFGDFWHSRIFTGKSNFEHETELVEAYADIGIECLVLWEGEVKKDPDSVKARLVEFLR